MTTRVYQFRLDAPLSGERAARTQMAAAHSYANDLISIERGRRGAMRAVHDVPAVRETEALLKSATRSSRKAAIKALWAARREAERAASAIDETIPEIASAIAALAAIPKDATAKQRSVLRRSLKEARAAHGDELARIQLLDESIRRDARALATCHWGSYLTIEASADQARKAPLYGDDHLTAADPRFRRGGKGYLLVDDDERAAWWCAASQAGMHVQGRVCTTSSVLAGRDPWVRLEDVEPIAVREQHHTRRAVLALRLDADTWARWPIRMHREIPDAARWSWVRVSCRPQRGAVGREVWTVEITVDDPAPRVRDLAMAAQGPDAATGTKAIAVELLWTPIDDGRMRVARWLDSAGRSGEVVLPREMVRGLGEIPAGIRAVRDLARNALLPKLQAALREWSTRETHWPEWLARATATLHLWQSCDRLRELAMRWRKERYDGAREAYELLEDWEIGAWRRRGGRAPRDGEWGGDVHLDDYEDGTRARSLRWRRETYRVLAARWSREYAVLLVPDRDLSREARWGDESEQRFLASPQELRQCLRQAFGDGADDVPWRGPHGVIDNGDEEDDVPEWLEMAIERWRDKHSAGGARAGGKEAKVAEVRGGAWARRQAAARDRDEEMATARKAAGIDAE